MELNRSHIVSVRSKPDAELDLIDPINKYDPELGKKAAKLRSVVDNVILTALMEA